MSLKNISIFAPKYWLYFFIFLHIFLWTMVPSLVRLNLPMDAIEGAIWGRQLEWGYDKNPFVNAWLTRLAIESGQGQDWPIYLFSQLSVGVCFWAIWQLAKKIVAPIYALLAVLLLEGIQYYNFHAIDFNDNVLELSFWALTLLFFYQSLKDNRFTDWICTGLFAGLGMMTKYYTFILLLPMLFFLIANEAARKNFKNPKLYISCAVFLCVILPHSIWLFYHDFITIHYAINRTHAAFSWMNHIRFPWQFFIEQFTTLLPTLILFSFLWIGKKTKCATHVVSTFDKSFLIYVGVGPFILTLLLSTIAGMKLRAGWGQPLLSFSGLLLMISAAPVMTRARFIRFMTLFFILLSTAIIIYCTSLIHSKQKTSGNFPGKIIASTFTKEWHNHFKTPLHYVAGARWLAGNIAFYSKDHPAVLMDWNDQASPWIDEKKLKQSGALFVWDPWESQKILSEETIRARFPHLGKIQTIKFKYSRMKDTEFIEIKFAFLAPEASNIQAHALFQLAS